MKALSSRHPHLPLLLIWLVATAFNITKAVHIDDTIYLEIARWITVSPLHPMVGRVNWVNTLEPISQISSSPLLFVYGLAAVVRVFGESEIALHGLMALLTGVCIWSFYHLATLLRIRDKMALTAMLALGPALLPSQNLMLDVPLVAFSLLFFWALLASYEASSRRKTALLILAGLAAGAGALTKYPGLILIPLLVVYVVATRQFVRACFKSCLSLNNIQRVTWALGANWERLVLTWLHLQRMAGQIKQESLGGETERLRRVCAG